MSLVTVVIVNWNGGVLLDECLACLMRQSLPSFRILVMDNGSTDGSAERAQQMPGVTIRMLDANLGFAAANNRALEQSDTEFIALLNPDAFPEPDWLMRLVAAAYAHPDVAAFGSRQMMQKSPGTLDGIGDVYHISGSVWRNGHGRAQRPADCIGKEIFSPCAGAALYRRDVLVTVGGFDEDFFCYVEDIDLGFRLRLEGHTCIYVPEAVVHHVGSALTGGQYSDLAVYYCYRNLVWAFFKNMPGILFWLFLPIHVFFNLKNIVHFSRHARSKLILKAKLDAIKGIPKMWCKRREIQTRRCASIGSIWRILNKGWTF